MKLVTERTYFILHLSRLRVKEQTGKESMRSEGSSNKEGRRTMKCREASKKTEGKARRREIVVSETKRGLLLPLCFMTQENGVRAAWWATQNRSERVRRLTPQKLSG